MTHEHEDDAALQSGVSRRTIVAGAAWSVPVLGLAAAAPAHAASACQGNYVPLAPRMNWSLVTPDVPFYVASSSSTGHEWMNRVNNGSDYGAVRVELSFTNLNSQPIVWQFNRLIADLRGASQSGVVGGDVTPFSSMEVTFENPAHWGGPLWDDHVAGPDMPGGISDRYYRKGFDYRPVLPAGGTTSKIYLKLIPRSPRPTRAQLDATGAGLDPTRSYYMEQGFFAFTYHTSCMTTPVNGPRTDSQDWGLYFPKVGSGARGLESSGASASDGADVASDIGPMDESRPSF